MGREGNQRKSQLAEEKREGARTSSDHPYAKSLIQVADGALPIPSLRGSLGSPLILA